ncbi:MAG: porphobilinogen synthase [Sphingomonadaceae bacterium]|nr:porphobilinogen synthase [Sphingomonadaceae bacterium]
MIEAPFPAARLRRTRMSAWSRDLHAEVTLTPQDFIWPVFVTEGPRERLRSLPFVQRVPLNELGREAKAAAALGIRVIALFPHGERRSDDARTALDPANLMCRAIAELKAAAPQVGVLADVALDPYTAHGHDGLLAADGTVDNDATLVLLTEQAVIQARAGADIVAPSDMMDGRVSRIRSALESSGHATTQIMAYSAKYASCLYGPFREAVGSAGALKGDKRNYQMDPRNAREALREAALDLAEGADSLMVKPGMVYLDILRAVAEGSPAPVFAYHTSGEAAMIEGAAAMGALDRERAIVEVLTAFRRAGARGVLTYHALDAARLIGG